MRVQQLIEELQRLDAPDAEVVYTSPVGVDTDALFDVVEIVYNRALHTVELS